MDQHTQPMEDVKEPTPNSGGGGGGGAALDPAPKRQRDEKDEDKDEQPSAKKIKILPSAYYDDNKAALDDLCDVKSCGLPKAIAQIIVDYTPVVEVKPQVTGCTCSKCRKVGSIIRDAKSPDEVLLNALAGRMDRNVHVGKGYFDMQVARKAGKHFIMISESLPAEYDLEICPVCIGAAIHGPVLHFCGCQNDRDLTLIRGTSQIVQGRFIRLPSIGDIRKVATNIAAARFEERTRSW